MEHSPETRPSLVARLGNARDGAAWSEFLAVYEPLILRLMRKNGLQESDARDICQQVLAAVARDVNDWQPDGQRASFRRWLFQIARNRVIKFLVKRRKEGAAAGGTDAHRALEAHPDPHASASAEFEREHRQQLLLYAAEQIRGEFHVRTWAVFWRTCSEGRSIAEAAAEYEMTSGNVYVARSRVVARLRQRVEELEADE
jgi:RNA polymerase sigma factor (sigma-70 family)